MRDWLAARAAATPGREALVAGDTRLTYGELNKRVAQLCAAWHGAGLKSGQRVAMVMHGNCETVVRLFAAMRLGHVLVPLGKSLTAGEHSAILQNAKCHWLLPESTREPLLRLPGDGVSDSVPVPLDATAGQAGAYLDGTLRPSAPLAIVHTSGTTGVPKGVVLTTGNFFFSAMGATLRLGHLPQDRWLCVMPLWHVGGLALVTRAILQGATVVLHPRFDAEAFMHALQHEGVTMVSLVPAMLHRALDHLDGGWPGNLRIALIGGAPLSSALHEWSIDRALPVAPTWGLTETCSQVATLLPAGAGYKPGSTGKPLLFSSLRIADDSGQDLAKGEIGEIRVSGATVMQGYLGDRQSTSAAICDGELRTGDLGYLDDEGDLYVVQRLDDLIISGGENVYPTEIERVLIAHPLVEDAVVLGIEDAGWGQRVAAVVQARRTDTFSVEDLSAHLRKHISAFKLPRKWRITDKSFRPVSGKVRRSDLAKLFEVD
ncbi:MAG: o-succinylbenzoate--CoA ligase [Anaerolineaceae bacterium]|nr:o-succinylbenzoate--CoA ligase [Anaerolineaceae bacterium]MCY3906771.1 o-succinylbenzoate--CoA ligase [Anaerolineaceae bacterium]